MDLLVINCFKKIKAEQKEDNDQDDVISEIKALKQEVKEYNDSANTDRGSINQILTDMRTAEQQVGQAAMEIKRTLVTGGGQKQGAWGQMVLNNILTNNLGFREGHEYLTQESYNTEEGNLQPDVIINYPDGKCMIVDSKVSLTAFDEYANSSDERTKEDCLLYTSPSPRDPE